MGSLAIGFTFFILWYQERKDIRRTWICPYTLRRFFFHQEIFRDTQRPLQWLGSGKIILDKPDGVEHVGAAKTWECITDYINKAKNGPVAMDKMVNRLRQEASKTIFD
jgi:hypothetical protein